MEQDKKCTLLDIFGKNVRKYRVIKKFSIKKLSKKSKIRVEYISKIEQGKAKGVKTSHLFALAEALQVEPYYLVKDENY